MAPGVGLYRPVDGGPAYTWTARIKRKCVVFSVYGQNGDIPKRLQVQSKRINLLASTMDLFSDLLTKFQLIQLCSFCSAVIS